MDELEDRLERLERILRNPAPVTSAEAVSLKDYLSEKLDTLDRTFNAELTELKARMAGLETEIKALRSFKDQMKGKASANSVYIAYFISFVGIVLSLIKMFS